jgi:hypothetical protein
LVDAFDSYKLVADLVVAFLSFSFLLWSTETACQSFTQFLIRGKHIKLVVGSRLFHLISTHLTTGGSQSRFCNRTCMASASRPAEFGEESAACRLLFAMASPRWKVAMEADT